MERVEVAAIILARSTSGRLPKKHMRKIGDRRMFEYVLNIPYHKIIATTKDSIEDFASFNVPAFAPNVDENNTIGRVKAVAKTRPDVDYFFIVSGDCPLISHNIMNRLLTELHQNPEYDAATTTNTHHLGVDIVRASAIEKLRDGEHFSVRLSDIKLLEVSINDLTEWQIRVTVDNMADLFFQNEAYKFCVKAGISFTYENVLKLPAYYYNINYHVGQKTINKVSKTYIITAKGNDVIGIGHVSRAVALCQHYTECCNDNTRLYINNDPLVIDYIEKQGFIKDLDYFIEPPVIDDEEFDKYIFITDTPEHETLNYQEIYKEDPTFGVNLRMKFVNNAIFGGTVVSFGKGAFKKFGEKLFNVLVDKPKTFLYNVDNVNEYIVGADRIITVWSQFAREAISLGKVPECYAQSEDDENTCLELHYKKYLIYKGRMN